MTGRGNRSGRVGSNSNQDNNDMSLLVAPDDVQLDKTEQMFIRLTKLVTDSFTTCMTKLIASIEDKLNLKMDVQSTELFTVNQRLDQLGRKVEDLTTANLSLKAQLQECTQHNLTLQTVVESLEQYTRSDSVLLHGLPLPQGQPEDLYNSIPQVLNNLIPSAHLTADQISIAHRLPSSSPPNSGSSASASAFPSRPPPVVIRFVRKATRVALMSNRRQLKGKGIVLSDHLTPARAALLKKASALVTDRKLASAWSQDGKILVKNNNNRTVPITCDDDLQQFN
jgi:hypothetical protein